MDKESRKCGAYTTEYFQTCIPKDQGCPIRDFKIVKKSALINDYIKQNKNKLDNMDPWATARKQHELVQNKKKT